MSTPEPDTKRAVLAARDRLILAVRTHEPRERQLALADEYIAAITAHAKAIGRKMPIPNRMAVLRQLA